MENKNINVDELSGSELMKVIYKEIKVVLDKHTEKLKEHDKRFDNLENKIENETEERKVDISRIEGKNNFDRIVLSDFGTRLTILEEEGEKYNIN